jgi:DNA-binding SARP family transcriptional activator/WD40 repeat protein
MGVAVTETLRFGVLGPLEVTRTGQRLRLGGERQRALLALLLLHANELVSTEQLVDQLSGGDASEGAVNSLYVAVSRLRRLLQGSGADEVLVTRPGGYVLVTEPGALDLESFEALLAEARQLQRDGQSDSATARLREALAMWRGPPFADVASLEFLQPEIRRLEELRLTALMERIEADLAAGRDTDLVGELEMLVRSNPLQERLRGQLMIALYRAGRQTDALAVYRQTSELLRDELGLEPSQALQDLEHSILTHDPSLEPARRRGQAPPLVCPFKGLASFDRSDADYYFGRERAIYDLIARLAASPLVGIIGASGIGKSSLLRAGVLASLNAGALPGSATWSQVVVRPGDHPLEALRRALDDADLSKALARLKPGERLVVAVDQLEEVFTACEDEEERAGFLAALAAAAQDPMSRAVVVVALRADFYGRVAPYSPFADLLSPNHVLVGPMDREGIVRAIELPAARASLEVERPLVDALVRDIDGEPGGLPLLSTALLELWRDRDGEVLRHARYQSSGGVRGAVARMAEEAYSRLSAHDRAVARTLLLGLARGADDSLVRVRVSTSELERIDGAAIVLRALTDARLVTVRDNEVEVSHEALIREWPRYRAWLEEDRVGRRAHEHLTASAQEWDSRGRESAELYRGPRLTAALDWAAQHDEQLSPSERQFLSGSRRQADREARRLRAFLVAVAGLLVVSIVAGIVALVQQDSARSAARVALSRELGAEAVNVPRIDVAMLLATEAVKLDRSPQTESTLLATLLRAPAVIGTISLPSNTSAALGLSPDGHTLAAADGLGELRLFNARTRALSTPPVGDISEAQPPVYSDDGKLLAHRSVEPSIVVRDAGSLETVKDLQLAPTAPPSPSDIPGGSIAISPDKRMVYYAYWGLDGAGPPGSAYIQRWSLSDPNAVHVKRIGSGGLLALRIVEGGSRVMIVSPRSLSVFDARTLRLLRTVVMTPAPVAPTAAAISPDGRLAVIGSQTGSLSFLDTLTGNLRQAAEGQHAAIARILFQSQGRTVVSVANDDSVIVWDPQTARPDQVLSGPAGPVAGAAITPDGSTLYTSSFNGLVLAWDLTGERRFGSRFAVGSVPPCCDPVSPRAPPLVVSPDGSRFATRLGSSTVGLFSSRTRRLITSFATGHDGNGITALVWSPASDRIAVGGHSGLVQLWSASVPPKLERTFTGLHSRFGQPEAIQAVAFSSDGKLLAASDDDKIGSNRGTASNADYASIAIWRTATGKPLASPKGLNAQGGHGVERFAGDDLLAFSPRGRLLAVSLFDRSIVIFDASSGDVVQVLAPDAATTSLAFATDGTLANGTAAGTVEFWNLTTGNRIGSPLVAGATAIAGIAFDAGGERFVTSGLGDGTVKLWFTATLQQQGSVLSTDQGATASVVFERDVNRLVAVDDAGKGFTWPTSLDAWEDQACAVAGRNLTRREWSQLIIGRTYAPICP